METEITSSIISAVAPKFIDIISNFVKPKLAKFVKENIQVTEEDFSGYLLRKYQQYSFINTLALKNQQTLLKDLYIPLSLRIGDCDFVNGKSKDIEYRIEGYPKKLIDKYMRLMIIDTAGMGKSTLTRRMFLDVIDSAVGIPVIIDLRRLNEKNDIINEILEQLNSINKNFDRNKILEFIVDGQFIFFFDGYDEIPSKNKEFVTKNIKEFISKAPNNFYIMTSRPDNSLSCFGDFQKARIMPLKREEAYKLIRKYDKIGDLSKRLIEKLNEPTLQMMDEFLINPLLVTLLFVSYKYKETIPPKKHLFYEQVYNAYYDDHDLSKGDSFTHEKKSNLDSCEFNKVLRYLGLKCVKLQRTEFSQSDLEQMIQDVKDECCEIIFSVSDFFDDIISSVPLFIQDGLQYRWAHKSLQEYFCARYIYVDSRDKQEKLLLSMFNSDKIFDYENILDIYYDMDYVGFEYSILLDFYKHYIEHFNSLPEEQDLKTRVLMFNKKYFYIYADSKEMVEFIFKKNFIYSQIFAIEFRYITKSNPFVILECFKEEKYYILKYLLSYKNSSIIKRSKKNINKLNLSGLEKNILVPINDDTTFSFLHFESMLYFDYSYIKERYEVMTKELERKRKDEDLFS